MTRGKSRQRWILVKDNRHGILGSTRYGGSLGLTLNGFVAETKRVNRVIVQRVNTSFNRIGANSRSSCSEHLMSFGLGEDAQRR